MARTLTEERAATRADFRILTVCIGNICRSPLAAQLLIARFAEAGMGGLISVRSAGLAAVVGAPMDLIPAEISERHGGAPTAHRAQQISPELVFGSELILTMTRQQRDEVIRLHPRALQRTFSIGELTRLMSSQRQPGIEPSSDDDDGEGSGAHAAERGRAFPADAANRLRSQTLAMSRIRSRARILPGDDVQDPYRRSREVHEGVGQQISLACTQIAHNIAGWATAPAAITNIW